MPAERVPKPTLAIERTHLAWERTAIGYLAIAAIGLFHHLGPLGESRTTLAGVVILLALMVFGISRARGRITVSTDVSGHQTVPVPTTAVPLIGWGTALLAAAIVVALMLG